VLELWQYVFDCYSTMCCFNCFLFCSVRSSYQRIELETTVAGKDVGHFADGYETFQNMVFARARSQDVLESAAKSEHSKSMPIYQYPGDCVVFFSTLCRYRTYQDNVMSNEAQL
jgi:hypothetical protein